LSYNVVPTTRRFGCWALEPHARSLAHDGQPVDVGDRAFDVLWTLVESAGQVVETHTLLQSVWPGRVVEENNVQVQVSALRRLLGRHAIRTVRGRGYQFTLGLTVDPCLVATHSPMPAKTNSHHGLPSQAPTLSAEPGEAAALAVLPFANRSGLPEDEVFALGMVEDLISALSQHVFFRVVSSSATWRFCTGAKPDLAEMSRELGVRYILEGGVRRSGPDLSVTAQLVEAASGRILWSQRFDRPLADLATMQGALVSEVAATLGVRIQRLEMERALKKPADLTAWECVMRYVAAYRQLNARNMLLAREEALRAVALGPGYGVAHATLAVASAWPYALFSADAPDEVRRIESHIDRALALDPDNPVVLVEVAEALSCIGRALEGLAFASQAAQMKAHFEWAHFACGVACVILNRNDEAITHFANVRRLAPGSLHDIHSFGWEATAQWQAGDCVAAQVAYARSRALTPHSSRSYFYGAAVAEVLGQHEEARVLMAKARHLEPTANLALWAWRFDRVFGMNDRDKHAALRVINKLWAEAGGVD
jgi:TolB-like protein/tetratricopeptide (TPR) repeat protein